MSKPTFYITTPIYYPSDRLHIGHAYTTVAADAMARYKRMRGFDVRFLTGSDEHGQKIERKAASQGLTPLQYVDPIVDSFKSLWQLLQISYDDFIRTTEARHIKAVQTIFQRIWDKGDIYKSEYEGWYCTPCETFWTERQIKDSEGKRICPDCDRPVELLKEESYFFKMSKYADRLLKHIEDNPEFIQPVIRRNEMVNFIKQGLEDLCVSRTTFKWGIPVPINQNHVIYVWFDALSNYITALGYGQEDQSLYQRYWPCDIHLVGKDIVRFHTIIWPIILMALEEPLPKKVFGHGWLLLDSGKMSKSKGNVVNPVELAARYGVDAIRYYLLRELPGGMDGNYSEESLITRINTDLANDLGNLLNRSLAMTEKFTGGQIFKPDLGHEGSLEKDVQLLAAQVVQDYSRMMDNFDLPGALTSVWKLVGRMNKYIDERAPWALAKKAEARDELQAVLYHMAEALRIVAILVTPAMPSTAQKILEQLGVSQLKALQVWESAAWGLLPDGTITAKGDPLFPRIDMESVLGKEEETVTEEKTAENINQTAPTGVETQAEQAAMEPLAAEIAMEDFMKVDLRVVEVLEAKKVAKADKLLELKVKLGDETRTIVSGIAKHYEPEKLVGKRLILVANLKPAKLRGIVSQGMILAASNGDVLEVLEVEAQLPAGSRVK